MAVQYVLRHEGCPSVIPTDEYAYTFTRERESEEAIVIHRSPIFSSVHMDCYDMPVDEAEQLQERLTTLPVDIAKPRVDFRFNGWVISFYWDNVYDDAELARIASELVKAVSKPP